MDLILKVRDFVEKIVLWFAVVLLSLVAIFIVFQVFLRTLNVGVNWTEEFARFSYVGVTFLGSILAVTKGKHITITFLADLMPDSVRRVLAIAIHLSMAALMIVCTYGSVLLMAAAQGVGSNSVMWFKLNYLYGAVLVSCVLMILVCLIRALEFTVKKEMIGRPNEL
jgi:TRAP-type C4-dicarboxylate transport system permease small subunit